MSNSGSLEKTKQILNLIKTFFFFFLSFYQQCSGEESSCSDEVFSKQFHGQCSNIWRIQSVDQSVDAFAQCLPRETLKGLTVTCVSCCSCKMNQTKRKWCEKTKQNKKWNEETKCNKTKSNERKQRKKKPKTYETKHKKNSEFVTETVLCSDVEQIRSLLRWTTWKGQ